MQEVDSSSARFSEVSAVEEMGMAMAASRSKASAALSASGKACKRRSRASNKPPITVLSADTANFRAMVQKLTGIPPPLMPQTFPAPASSSILQQYSPSSFSQLPSTDNHHQQSFYYRPPAPTHPTFNTAGFPAHCFEQPQPQQQQQIPVSAVPGSGFASMPGLWNARPPPPLRPLPLRDDVSTSRGLMMMTSLMGAGANPDYWLSSPSPTPP